eukprot:8762515-Pyramimonas_sp.AAC.1
MALRGRPRPGDCRLGRRIADAPTVPLRARSDFRAGADLPEDGDSADRLSVARARADVAGVGR